MKKNNAKEVQAQENTVSLQTPLLDLESLTPRQIVAQLDKYVIGQEKAKRVIAVALRNRQRRKKLSDTIRDEVLPKNIIMIGPTGVGKTEIARRISKLFKAPFIKVEATKYTEIGYVGRDVESMVRDLAHAAFSQIQGEMREANLAQVQKSVNEALLTALMKPKAKVLTPDDAAAEKKRIAEMLENKQLEDELIDIDLPRLSSGPVGVEIGMLAGSDMADATEALNSIINVFHERERSKSSKKKRFTVKEAREILTEAEEEKAFDFDKAREIVKERVEEMGIIFIDEIDKIAETEGVSNKANVSREGVQRDILPIVEGCKVSTKFGLIDTTHILFIAAGAFHLTKPSDLIPELQGRFPLRVELDDLSSNDFYRILTEPKNALIKQYQALMATEGVDIVFEDSAIKRISEIAYEVNKTCENIGARRLYTVMEKLFDDISFNADENKGKTITITPDYVDQMLKDIASDQDLSKYIL